MEIRPGGPSLCPLSRPPVRVSTPSTATGTVECVSREAQKNPFPLRVRIVQWSFLAAAVIATLCLAWWQWDRWHDSDGTFQNLGYALQWPLFGIFFIVAYRKYMEYERDRANGEEAPAVAKPTSPDEITELSTDVLPQRGSRQRSGDAADVFTDDRRRRAREAREARETRGPGTTSTDENRIS